MKRLIINCAIFSALAIISSSVSASAIISSSVSAHGNSAAICPTLVKQYEDSIPDEHKNTAKLVKTKNMEVRTLFLSNDSLKTVTFRCPKESEFMNSTTCRFNETGLFRTKELVRPVPIEDSDFGSVGKVHRKQHLYECKFVIGYTLG
ncbi:hypothetical protein OH460_07510 [Vibrio sp. Makdt]|uniref:hypothetical protein n=1 Tax=Vibrio sp. Makdt TaxID=2998828 RepID=UPI0022CDAD44|nr:hypothetical protein [Vibrio sp. Makdt]MDA0152144.1 hypothetical protein [Vibrio sp. Makdt]